MSIRTLRQSYTGLLVPFAGLLFAAGVSLFWNLSGVTPLSLAEALFGSKNAPDLFSSPEYSILVQIRMPRILIAIFAGGCLGVAGALFQILLRNVLADPYILGIASGSTVGAYLTIATGLAGAAFYALPLGSFAGSVAVALVVFYLSRSRYASDHNALLLSGVMVGTFLSAFTLLILNADRSTYQSAIKWMLGSLANSTMDSIYIIAPAAVFSLMALFFNAHSLNILALGTETAQQLGLSSKRFSMTIYGIACLLTSVIVAFTGSIGFVGLVIPHICRLIYGPDNRLMLPAVFLVGGLFLVCADFLARIILYPVELPVGAITALLGAPLFIYLLKKR